MAAESNVVWKEPLRAPALPEDIVEAALVAALDAHAGCAFVFGERGEVSRSNRAGLSFCAADAKELVLELAEGGTWPRVVPLRGRDAAYVVRPLVAHDAPFYYLAIERHCGQDVATRIATATERWRLSRRQSDTLRLLSQGLPNKLIADRLGIALGTVEIHVSKVLRQAGCDSRAALAARFWSGVID